MRGLRIGGHPLHPALVHFPIAAWTLALIGDGVYLATGDPTWWRVAYWAIVGGVVTGLLAMTAGMAELATLPQAHRAWRSVNWHMSLMGSAWTLFTINALLRDVHSPATSTSAGSLAALTLLSFLLLIVGGHFGAKLVYEDGVGWRPFDG